jgi:hypothetical protein
MYKEYLLGVEVKEKILLLIEEKLFLDTEDISEDSLEYIFQPVIFLYDNKKQAIRLAYRLRDLKKFICLYRYKILNDKVFKFGNLSIQFTDGKAFLLPIRIDAEDFIEYVRKRNLKTQIVLPILLKWFNNFLSYFLIFVIISVLLLVINIFFPFKYVIIN